MRTPPQQSAPETRRDDADPVDARSGARTMQPAKARVPEWAILLAVYAAACTIVISRRPDALLNPQFYMEDGSFWYFQAHEMGGLSATLEPARGYFQTSARLGAWLA